MALVAIVLGLIISKFVSGYIGGRLAGHKKKGSMMFGIASTHQLTTTLAISFAGAYLNIFDTTILTAIVLVSIITTIGGPMVLRLVSEAKA
jgi:Kef-type K+ transport system membrane component KefB